MKKKSHIGMVVVILLVIALTRAAGPFSVTNLGSKDLTFTAESPGGVPFKFGNGCEEMTPLAPVLNEACAAAKQEQTGIEVINVGAECTTFPLMISGSRLEFRPGQSYTREGYTISLAESSASWSYGDFSTVVQNAQGQYSDVQSTGTRFNEFSATWKISLAERPVDVEVQPDRLTFTKKLPSCVPAGVAISDSPRILGASVVDNKDGTFTSVGNVQQAHVQFPAAKSGGMNYAVSSELGAHTLVFKPFVEANGKSIDVLPEKSASYFREGPNLVNVLSEAQQRDLPSPSIIDQFLAWLKNLLGAVL